MTEDEMYDIIRGYEESECDFHERNIELENENAKLRELLSMYMTFARTVARGLCIQSAYPDGMGRKLNETEMRERAMKLGIEWCR